MRKAGLAAGEVLDRRRRGDRAGVTTDYLDGVAHEAYIARGGYPSPLHYRGFPKSICTSVNEVICHGIPNDQVLKDGDIVNVDVTIFLDGVHGDTNATFAVGEIDPHSPSSSDVTRECLGLGIHAVDPARRCGRSGVRSRSTRRARLRRGAHVLRSRHRRGVPRRPVDPALRRAAMSCSSKQGMTFTIEPMITMGSWRERIWPDGWTAVTADGLRTAQYEHTIVVTDDGAEVLTPSTALAPAVAAS